MGTEPAASFDHLLRQARRAAGLTQEALAERAGVSTRLISDIERGVIRAPRPDTLELLADALELGPNERVAWKELRRQLSRRGPLESLNQPISLPVPMTSFIGREHEISELCELLCQPAVRLVTLTGPGGIGKTRLAIEAARAAMLKTSSGVVFVDLTPVDDPARLVQAIAATLGLRESADRSLDDALIGALRDKQLLLVLDNFEQLVDAGMFVSDLLRHGSRVTVVVTSRVPLRLQGERLYPVPPLGVPAAGRAVDTEHVLHFDAVRLFVQRAHAAHPDFDLTPSNARAVVEICTRLDGLPLAIELAAARIAVLSPESIRQRLDQSLQMLAGGARDLPERQRTLRNTIAWSYDLLSPTYQQLLRRLSVFAGGWSLEAAEAVVSGSDPLTSEVFAGLMELTDQSLIRSTIDADGETRFQMLETIREFAREQLIASAEAEALHAHHAEYFLTVAEAADAHTGRRDESVWHERLEREHDNLRAALNWLVGQHDVERALRLAGALGAFWFNRAYLSEGQMQIAAVLAIPGADSRTAARAHVLAAEAWLAGWQGGYEKSLSSSEEALAIWEELGDRDHLPHAYLTLGIQHAFLEDFEQALAAWEHADRIAREVNDQVSLARLLTNRGVFARSRGELSEAERLLHDGLSVAKASQHPATISLVLDNLAGLARARGDVAEAENRDRENLRVAVQLGMKWTIAQLLDSRAEAALRRGQTGRAARLHGAAQALRARHSIAIQPIARDQHERLIADLRAALGDAFEEAVQAGEAMSLDAAIEEALHPQ